MPTLLTVEAAFTGNDHFASAGEGDNPAFSQTEHRPWPLPEQPWVLRMVWKNLLFLHWKADLEDLRRRIPEPLEIDTFEGSPYIGIVPFDMEGIAPRGLPAVKAISDFPEINVRTYVTYQGKPGVWFFSLDVPKPLAAWIARTLFKLNYRNAQIDVTEDHLGSIDYRHQHQVEKFSANYWPVAPVSPLKNSFETWATERYCLYTRIGKSGIYRTEVQHPRWPLEFAQVNIRENTLLEGFAIGEMHHSALFARHIDVVAYPPKRIF